jgi:hypothetical protein
MRFKVMNTNREMRLNWRRALLATTAALSLGAQNAYAVGSDGTTLPNDGFVVGRAIRCGRRRYTDDARLARGS